MLSDCLWLANSILLTLVSQKLYDNTKEKCLILNKKCSLADFVTAVFLLYVYLNVHLFLCNCRFSFVLMNSFCLVPYILWSLLHDHWKTFEINVHLPPFRGQPDVKWNPRFLHYRKWREFYPRICIQTWFILAQTNLDSSNVYINFSSFNSLFDKQPSCIDPHEQADIRNLFAGYISFYAVS